jgi:hypothetical protein
MPWRIFGVATGSETGEPAVVIADCPAGCSSAAMNKFSLCDYRCGRLFAD